MPATYNPHQTECDSWCHNPLPGVYPERGLWARLTPLPLATTQCAPMCKVCCSLLLLLCTVPGYSQSKSYLFVWAGDDAKKTSDFLAVFDSDAESPDYGKLVPSVAVPGPTGTPHHTELEMPEGGFLLTNGFKPCSLLTRWLLTTSPIWTTSARSPASPLMTSNCPTGLQPTPMAAASC